MLSSKNRPGSIVALALAALIAALACSTVLAGCGSNTPDGAVRKFLAAWQAGDWNAFKASIAPQRRNLSKDQEDLARQEFNQIKVKFNDIQSRTVYDPKDKGGNKATVTLTGGKITITTEVLGQKKTETRDVAPKDKQGKALQESAWPVVKVNGVWYVDTPLDLYAGMGKPAMGTWA